MPGPGSSRISCRTVSVMVYHHAHPHLANYHEWMTYELIPVHVSLRVSMSHRPSLHSQKQDFINLCISPTVLARHQEQADPKWSVSTCIAMSCCRRAMMVNGTPPQKEILDYCHPTVLPDSQRSANQRDFAEDDGARVWACTTCGDSFPHTHPCLLAPAKMTASVNAGQVGRPKSKTSG